MPCARSLLDVIRRARESKAGFDHHLVKPVKPDELDRLLTEL